MPVVGLNAADLFGHPTVGIFHRQGNGVVNSLVTHGIGVICPDLAEHHVPGAPTLGGIILLQFFNRRISWKSPVHLAAESRVVVLRSCRERVLAPPLIIVAQSPGRSAFIRGVHRLASRHGAQITVHHHITADLTRFGVAIVIFDSPDIPAPEDLAAGIVNRNQGIAGNELGRSGEVDVALPIVVLYGFDNHGTFAYPTVGRFRRIVPHEFCHRRLDRQIGLGIGFGYRTAVYRVRIGARRAVAFDHCTEFIGRPRLGYQISIRRTVGAQVLRDALREFVTQ